jgi:hypothetical protein
LRRHVLVLIAMISQIREAARSNLGDGPAAPWNPIMAEYDDGACAGLGR